MPSACASAWAAAYSASRPPNSVDLYVAQTARERGRTDEVREEQRHRSDPGHRAILADGAARGEGRSAQGPTCAATETIGAGGGLAPSEPKNGLSEKLKMPPSEATIR